MTEAVARQSGVVRLDVELEVLVEAVVAEEAYDRGRVVVILVLGGLHRLGLDQESPLESVLPPVILRLLQEHRHVVELPFHVGVPQTRVPLPAAPENVVPTA